MLRERKRFEPREIVSVLATVVFNGSRRSMPIEVWVTWGARKSEATRRMVTGS